MHLEPKKLSIEHFYKQPDIKVFMMALKQMSQLGTIVQYNPILKHDDLISCIITLAGL